ncbi:MAG: LysR family transcriptional regulator [Moritella sp.]|uniref:LysR family transcriptional regulator n=1 Tax=Moritella sp. TaxID=78556 RepID=UPI0029B5BC36|nr:LysR family transcriptional regulator [Moritella sp.]MDX2320876.1 LysR family transcriptional regulator [Moritella sp.]
MYSFEQLKIFVCVCECGSFSAAARQLKRAQSGVSQSIANLEIAVNQELFARDKNTPVLTDNGKALLPIARAILHQQHYFDQKVESLSSCDEHELVIAIDDSVINPLLLDLICECADRFPFTHIEILAGTTFDVEDMVRSGRAQVGILYFDGTLKSDMDHYILGHKKFITAVAPEHDLTKLAQVREADLQAHRQIVYRSVAYKELWFSYGISTNSWYTNSHQMLFDLASRGVGWAVVPASMAAPYLLDKSLVALPVVFEPNGWMTAVGCLVSRRQKSGPVLVHILSMLQTQYDVM